MALIFYLLIAGALLLFAIYYSIRKTAGRSVPFRLTVMLATLMASAFLFALLSWGMLLVALTEPWPISLRHGPDTETAEAQFVTYIDKNGASVARDIYVWRQWAGPGEHVLFICYQAEDPQLNERLILWRGLTQADDEAAITLRVWDSGPYWWPTHQTLSEGRPLFTDGGGNPQAYTYFWPSLCDEGRSCLLEVDIG